MTIWALLLGLPWIIGGIQGHNRRHNSRHAPSQAAQRYIEQEGDMPSEAEYRRIRRDAMKKRVRFVDPDSGEVKG